MFLSRDRSPHVGAIFAAERLAALEMGERDLTEGTMAVRPETWEALVQRHQRRVLVALLARGIPMERAKELAQETWMRLFEQCRRGRLQSLVLPGLAIRQAQFLAMEDLRRDEREVRCLPIDAGTLESVPSGQPNPEIETLGREAAERAMVVLGKCPAKAQRIVELAYGEEMLSHREIAARVGISLQRVRQTIHEVRQKLRAALKDPGEDAGDDVIHDEA
jgi:RNA polymerase sigma-70 factor (ECF subfamily)